MICRWIDLYFFGRRTDRPLSTRRAVALATLADVEARRPKPATLPLFVPRPQLGATPRPELLRAPDRSTMTVPQLAPLLAAGLFVGSLFASTPTPLAASPAVPVDPAAGLTVVADAPPVPGYARLARFGSWASTGHGCDVRDVILARDLTDDVTRGCHVIGGKLADPYSGTVTVGPSSRLDIDHVRALDDAWQHGAATWTDAQRRAFANDPAELRAVSAHDNRSKGDGGPDEWLPARDRCEYVEAYADVSRRYHLTVTVRQAAAIRRACA